jgi:uncharacterized SAM-binding protein YcdF (DUF218 family)
VTIPVVSILIAVAVVLSWLRWRKSSYIISGVALVLLLGVGCGPLAAILVGDLQAGYSSEALIRPARATAIVVLGNGTETPAPRSRVSPATDVEVGPLGYGRLVKALEVYQTCKRVNQVCFVLISGGDPQHHGASEAAVYGARLRQLGVPAEDLVLEERSLNTFQNAQYTAAMLRNHPADQVLLVSSGLHLRRSLLYFGHFGLEPQPVRADFVSAMRSPLPLSYNFLVTDLALHEYVGVARYVVYQHMGWNPTATRPRAP